MATTTQPTTPTKTVANQTKFLVLCKVCDQICSKQGKGKKQILEQFINKWRSNHSDLHKDDITTTDSFYPAMRLLLPQFDKERGAYGIKETTLAKYYIEILNLSKDSTDALKLLNYRAPQTAKAEAGDFANVAFFVLKHRCYKEGELTIEDINTYLDEIALSHAENRRDNVKKSLFSLLRRTSAFEQKWLIRIIMKSMKLGQSELTVLNAFHPDAKEAYDNSSSLLKVCTLLRDPSVRGHEIAISLFSPFRPMLAETANPEKMDKILTKTFYVENKLDGERVQMHTDGKKFMYFSRNSYDFSDSFGSTSTQGPLTCHIASCFKSHVVNCILDGEMVGYNLNTNCIGSKGENFDVKSLKDDKEYQPCFCVFDVVMYNGSVLTNLPFSERIKCLNNLFTPLEGRLQFTTRAEVKSKQDAIDKLNEAIDKREEGIVIKNPTSIYKPHDRKAGWYKIKPDYVDELMEQLDLLIIGGNFGEGRRRGLPSHFLLGVAVDPKIPGEKPTVFHSVCRVGSGYSLKELYELNMQLGEHWQKFDKNSPPHCIVVENNQRERPDIWIEPSKSRILQIKAAEINKSDKFKTGYTLRFPRVEKVRYDKDWHDCMTLSEFEQLRKQSYGKLALHHVSSEPAVKRQRIAVKEKPTLPPQFRGPDASCIKKESDLFAAKEFYVINGPVKYSKNDLETLIIKHGGEIVQDTGPDTYCVIADKLNARVRMIIIREKYDVVKCSWLLSCIEQKQLVNWTPSCMWYSTKKTIDRLALDFDEYGDSYTEEIDEKKLKSIFQQIDVRQIEKLSSRDILDLEMEYFPDSSLGLFRSCIMHFDQNPSLNLIRSKFLFYGGNVSEEIHKQVNHVVVHTNDLSNLEELKSLNRSRRQKFHIVSHDWIENSIKDKALHAEKNYQPT
uniref:DNA ligase n=1 Tax=Strigamia maritima TaxID=126957 RepID=T1JBC6_STRMM